MTLTPKLVADILVRQKKGRGSGTPLGEVEVAQAAATDAKLAHIRVDSRALNGREREQELLELFNEAAADVTRADLGERESLLGGFSSGSAAAHLQTALPAAH